MAVIHETVALAAAAFAADLAEHPMDDSDEFHLAGGFTGKISRNPVLKGYCCYLTSPPGVVLPDVDYAVHGGITYIMGETIGFDFMHCNDYCLSMLDIVRTHTWSYNAVKHELLMLHAQVVDALLPPQPH